MTPGQPTSFRLSEEAKQMLETLEDHLGLKKTSVIEMALRNLYRREIPGQSKDSKKPAKKKPKTG